MSLPFVAPARPPALPDSILRNMVQTGRDFIHGNADGARMEHALFALEAMITELLEWRAFGRGLGEAPAGNVVPLVHLVRGDGV